MTEDRKLLDAIACCREKRCEGCPLQEEICDELRVDMVDLPEELVELIEERLAGKRFEEIDRKKK